MQEVEFIVQGDVQGVGYRQYVAEVGNELRLAGSVENLKDGTVKIQCKGDEKTISEFKEKINVENPSDAPLVKVRKLEEATLPQGTIGETCFEEIYNEPSAEMSQGFSTGMKYIALFNRETQANLNLFRAETNANFARMDEKYHVLSENMIAIVNSIREENKTFKNEIAETNKNIESLLKILVEKKG